MKYLAFPWPIKPGIIVLFSFYNRDLQRVDIYIYIVCVFLPLLLCLGYFGSIQHLTLIVEVSYALEFVHYVSFVKVIDNFFFSTALHKYIITDIFNPGFYVPAMFSY